MRRVFRLVLIASIVLLWGSVLNTPAPTQAQGGRQVYAYFFGWYTGDSWGAGNLLDRPANPYNSADGGVIARQIGEAQSAGIDAFVMSWLGPGGWTNGVFNTLLDQAAARGFHAAASVDMFDQGSFASTGQVTDALRYLVGDRVNHPGYLRYNGKPVIYFWNQGRYSAADWANIRGQIDPKHTTIWVLEGTDTSLLHIFDGLYLFNVAWSGSPAGTASEWYGRTLGSGGTFYSATVMPGWDESRLQGRANPTAPQQRANGAFLKNSWYGAASSGANVITIVSWNEYPENSYIEPSQLYGTQSLDVLRPLISAWKGHGPVAPPPAAAPQGGGSAPPAAAAPAGQTVSAVYDTVKVRSGPGTTYNQIGEIHQGETYALLEKANGWYKIDFKGQPGYVASGFVTVH